MTAKWRHAAIATILGICSMAAGLALSPTPKPQPPTSSAIPSFEVATVKPSASLEQSGSLRMQPGGLFRSINLTVRDLIVGAHRTPEAQLFPSQIIGGPSWLATDRYDIAARVGAELAALPQAELFTKLPILVQSLLADRFKLKTHHETRELTVYILNLLRRDGSLGPQLRPATVDCAETPSRCAIQFQTGHISGGAVNPESLRNVLAGAVEQVVIDRTGLTGRYDLNLEWSPDQTASDKPSIFAAVQEQLGLRLDATKAPVDVLVIDRVERPTEN
jgi:uncharacterized protein (TIGR03435 family)